jgi:dTDP-4-amino-4,6-dideoxygalactose transaminase
MEHIPFNKPFMTGKELWYIAQAHANGALSGDGPFTKKCHKWLEEQTDCASALLTHSCTAALEMAALLINVQPDDEVIMPSYTFVSTANAFVLRGGIPVFVDIRPDTLNIDESLIEAAITSRTKAIVPVHYAGVGCEMDAILEIADRHNLLVIEDAAQGMMAKYRGKPLGAIGHLGAYSFHETKNVISGEGGCLLVNGPEFSDRAEIIREKGTNRSQFFRGQVDKYTWCDIGSSYLPGEIIAAFLWAQLEFSDEITGRRVDSWNRYHQALESLELAGCLRRPTVPEHCEHNGHMYYVLLENLETRTALINHLVSAGIHAVFHYVPLHSSPMGRKVARVHGSMHQTNAVSERLLRLPIYPELSHEDLDKVVNVIEEWFFQKTK